MEPVEIIAAPFEVYRAPVGTAFPAIDAAPAVSWVLIGTSGDRDIAEAGVTVTHNQTVVEIRTNASTGPRKAVRSAEELIIEFDLVNLKIAEYAKALNDHTVTDTAPGTGTAGHVAIPLYQGFEIAEHALLVRGASPEMADTFMQYEVPRVYQAGNPAPVYAKTGAAMLRFQYKALEDENAATDAERFGHLRAQDAAAL